MEEKRLSDKEFKEIFSKVPRACVDLVIKDSSGKILLTKRKLPPNQGKWNLPGGGVKFEETLKDAISRISKSELGAEAKPVKLIGFAEFVKETNMYGGKMHSISLVFLVKIPTKKIALNDEQAIELGFFKEIPENTVEEHRQFIIKNLSYSKIAKPLK